MSPADPQESERLEPYAWSPTSAPGQPHMLAISKRRRRESVTDVLVTRGNSEVEPGGHQQWRAFLGLRFLHMIQRAEGDPILAEQLGLREDIPGICSSS
jgi:hypothetical protein